MTAPPASLCYRFGRFELQPDKRRLLAAGTPVDVGSRAFDLLVMLVERDGHLVTKDELLERVWPKAIVEENTLQAQVSALRKILGAEAIATISGRGYRFALELSFAGAESVVPKHNLPQQLTSFIGREKEIAQIKVLRRCKVDVSGPARGDTPRAYRFAGWELNVHLYRLHSPDGSRVEISRGEFGLLRALLSSPHRILTREQLLKLTHIDSAEVYDRSIDTQVMRLRRKIEADPTDPRFIRTARGTGYYFDAPVNAVR